MRRGDEDESGAVALMVGLLSFVLLSVAAFAVDIGRAYVERQDIQKLTDLAALAGGAGNNLPGTTSGTCAYGSRSSAGDQAVVDVASYLGTAPWTGGPSPASLVNCDLSDGEVMYGTLTIAAGLPSLAFDKTKLTVVSPETTVEFGLAQVMGVDEARVQRRATVAVGTPGAEKVFPAFATDGCDWGQHTIFAPAGSTTGPSFTPALAFPSDKNITTFDLAIENPSPDSVPVNPSATTLTIAGTNLDTVTKIGFFQEDTLVVKEIPQVSFDSQNATRITVTVPDDRADLTTAAGLWWVRVYAPKTSPTDTTKQWSEVKSGTVLKTIPFEVGESFLRCAGVASGSFGDLILPRTDVPNSSLWAPMNIAKNLQVGPPKLSLQTYPGAPTTVYGASSAPNTCLTSDARTVYSTVTGVPDLKANTNCVDNGTGLTANVATAGLIEGVPPLVKGRLDTGADSACAARRPVTLTGPTRTVLINNDVLTCFIQPGVTIGTIASRAYAGGPVLSCGVYDSPRFFYQPVVQVRPSGGSLHYSIVDFRPAFVSNQASTATNGSGPLGDNGVTLSSGQVTQLDVVFFHPKALPTDCSNAFGPTLGGTTLRAVRLVD